MFQPKRFFIRESVGTIHFFDVHDRDTVDAAGHTKVLFRRVYIEKAMAEARRLNENANN